MERLHGVLEGIIYHNTENGFTVFTLGQEDDVEEITCTGFLADPREGETLEVEGVYVQNPRYGKQLSVSKIDRVTPNTIAGIEKYLSSGVIRGIGAKTARSIVAKFGEQTFDIIENYPEKLAEIRGISPKQAHKFAESFQAQTDQRRVMLFLQEYGITPAFSMKIYKRYKEDTIETVKSNPYKLADDIDGIGFKSADAIAYKLGISRESPDRISAGVRYQLWEATNEGHTYMPTAHLVRQSAELLYADAAVIEHELVRMQMDRLIVREKLDGEAEPLVFVGSLYHAEVAVARKLASLDAAHSDSMQNTEIPGQARDDERAELVHFFLKLALMESSPQ